MSDEHPSVILETRGLGKYFHPELEGSLQAGLQASLRALVGGRVPPPGPDVMWALRDVDLRLARGDFLAVFGVNGSGKTTLLRVLSGIYQPDAGVVRLHRSVRRTVCVFSLRTGVDPLFSGRENVAIKGALYGLSAREVRAKEDWIVSFSELGNAIDRPFGSYSRGMKARLAFSIAVATEPDLLLLDETLAVGDPAFKAKCYEHLGRIVEDCAVVLATNSVGKASRFATRGLVLERGVVVAEKDDVRALGREFLSGDTADEIDEEEDD